MDDAVGDTELCVNLPAMLFGAKYCRLLSLCVMFTQFSSCQSMDLRSSEHQCDLLFNDELSC